MSGFLILALWLHIVHSHSTLWATRLKHLQGLTALLKCRGGASFIHSLSLSRFVFYSLCRTYMKFLPNVILTFRLRPPFSLPVGPGGVRGWKQPQTCQRQKHKVSANEQRRRGILYQVGSFKQIFNHISTSKLIGQSSRIVTLLWKLYSFCWKVMFLICCESHSVDSMVVHFIQTNCILNFILFFTIRVIDLLGCGTLRMLKHTQIQQADSPWNQLTHSHTDRADWTEHRGNYRPIQRLFNDVNSCR